MDSKTFNRTPLGQRLEMVAQVGDRIDNGETINGQTLVDDYQALNGIGILRERKRGATGPDTRTEAAAAYGQFTRLCEAVSDITHKKSNNIGLPAREAFARIGAAIVPPIIAGTTSANSSVTADEAAAINARYAD